MIKLEGRSRSLAMEVSIGFLVGTWNMCVSPVVAHFSY
jgi:hypothetical protein